MKPLGWASLFLTLAMAVWVNPAPSAAQPVAPFPFAYNPIVAQMMNAVRASDVYNYAGYLSGEFPVSIGGNSVTITSRNQYDSHLTHATQYVYEFMQTRGLSVGYQNWSAGGFSNRNVIGVITGTLHPEEIVLVTAHLDDMPKSSTAPGADDNASGSVGVIMAAAQLAEHKFSRTIRFIFFTGEEYGEYGSFAYAQACKTKNENLVAVYNLDMIGWDQNQDGAMALETRVAGDPGYANDLAITTVFTQVVKNYGLQNSLNPFIDKISDMSVDSWSFWSIGYPSVTAIEDWDEGNPYYHTVDDRLSTLNLSFFTNLIKASVGTAAHMAMPLNNSLYLPLVQK